MEKKFIQLQTTMQLRYGDIVRHVNHKDGLLTNNYIVIGNYGTCATAVDTVYITNPSEWEVLRGSNDE